MTTRVTILDDHQSIVDGYSYRLSDAPDIEVVATASYGEELAPLLADHPTDVLLLDVGVPTSRDNPNPYPVLHVIPELLQSYPDLTVLVISMYTERTLIRAVMEAGASGYILKDDRDTIQELGAVVRAAAGGGIHLSKLAHQKLFKHQPGANEPALSPRQLQALSLAAAFPDWTTSDLARKLGVRNSTARNLLSGAYLKLQVHSMAGAIARVKELGLIT